MIRARARTAAIAAAIVALAFTPPAATGGQRGDRDCDEAVEELGEAEVKLLTAQANDASKKRIKALKKKVRQAEKKVEKECDSSDRSG